MRQLSARASAAASQDPSSVAPRKPADLSASLSAPAGERRPDRWDVYKWVGKCLSEWEHTEAALSHFYEILQAKAAPTTAQRRYYGPRLFEDRTSQVERAADRCFAGRPNEGLRADLADLFARLRLAARSRDEIAEGMVVRRPTVSPLAAQRGETEFALRSRAGLRQADAGAAEPRYSYAENDLQRLALLFFSLALEVGRLRERIERHIR